MMNFGNFGYGFMGGFGWIFMIVFWGLVIWAIVALIRGNFGNGHGADTIMAMARMEKTSHHSKF